MNIVPIILAIVIVLLTVLVILIVKNLGGKAGSSSEQSSSQVSIATSDFSSQSEVTTSNSSQDGISSSASSYLQGGEVSSHMDSGTSSMDNAALAAEADKWYLKLANKQNPLPSNFLPTVSAISEKYTQYNDMKFDSRAVDALNNMCAAAKRDGSGLWVISSYRTVKRQSELFEQEVKNQMAKHPKYSDEQARTAAATVVAIPGTSEHNLGLAVDFNADQEAFENTPQSKWLRAHAEQYGFVLRYPKDKSNVTGIIYEPWHYRYVGVDHAKRMNQMGLCLEEYLGYLKGLK